MSTYESMEILGMATDDLASLLAATELPMPAQFHIDQLKIALPKIITKLRQVYTVETGDDPWLESE